MTPLVIGGLVAVVTLAAVAAAVISGAPPGVAEPAARVTISGTPLPELSDPAADPAIGQPVPTIAGVGLDGQSIAIGPDDGPMAIVALAHWCPTCQAELPGLVQLIEQGGVPDGVSVFGLSTGIDAVRPNYPPSAWLDRERWRQPTLIDDAGSHALEALGLNAFPGIVFVDGDGMVVQRLIGAGRFGEILASLAP